MSSALHHLFFGGEGGLLAIGTSNTTSNSTYSTLLCLLVYSALPSSLLYSTLLYSTLLYSLPNIHGRLVTYLTYLSRQLVGCSAVDSGV